MNFGLPHDAVEKIRDVFRSFPQIESAILFGSRAVGSFRPGSDIDLALCGDTVQFDDLTKLAIKLDDLNLVYKIDLVALHLIQNIALLQHIQNHGVEIYRRIP